MKRSININFIPISQNFSELEDFQEQEALAVEDSSEHSGLTMELTLLSMLYSLKNDKQRCVLFIELLRQLGYNLDYESSAKALNVRLRWYMRVKKSVKDLLKGTSLA